MSRLRRSRDRHAPVCRGIKWIRLEFICLNMADKCVAVVAWVSLMDEILESDDDDVDVLVASGALAA